MPITIKNSAGGGVTLDSSTSSNETINLNTPVFTGNVGVGSPLLTTTASNMLQIGSTSNLSWYNQGDDELDINVNAVNNSGNKYIEAKAASQYIQQAGAHYFKGAASGTAGAAISWTTAMTIATTGQLTFGTISAQAGAQISIAYDGKSGEVSGVGRGLNLEAGITGTSDAIRFVNPNGEVGRIITNGSATAYNTSSDYRLKENVTPMSGATAQTKLLKPCNFDWIAGGNVNGFIAHELAEVVPEAVTGSKDAMMDEEYEVTAATDTEAAVMGTRSVPDLQGIDQSKLVPLLTATIQDLITRIEALESK